MSCAKTTQDTFVDLHSELNQSIAAFPLRTGPSSNLYPRGHRGGYGSDRPGGIEHHPALTISARFSIRQNAWSTGLSRNSVCKYLCSDAVEPKFRDPDRQRDNPRPFFRFHPLVPKKEDAYKLVLETAVKMAEEEEVIRWIPVTDELYDLIMFVTHTFVRPIASELYALRHRDITVAEDPKRLLINIRDGKTGYRVSNSMGAAVAVYKRIKERYPQQSKPTDFLFLPDYPNRATASRIIQRQVKRLLELANLETDPFTGQKHSLYSLRHTAICMRIILSKGEVNIFNLAKNVGTSVDQIERFYARNLPLSAELAKNLQSFGES